MSVPMETPPGANVPPELTMMVPLTVPVPPSAPPFTVTAPVAI
jgi:hypothetical protein